MVAGIMKVLPSQRPHNIMNPAPSTVCHYLHLPLPPLSITQAGPFYAFLQLFFTTAKAEASHYTSYVSHLQYPLPKPCNKPKIFAPVTPLPGKTALQTRCVDFIWAKLILCFPTSTSTLWLCNPISLSNKLHCSNSCGAKNKACFILEPGWENIGVDGRMVVRGKILASCLLSADHRCQHSQQRASPEMMESVRMQKSWPLACLQHSVVGLCSGMVPGSIFCLKSVLSCHSSLFWLPNSFLTCHTLQFPLR